MYSVNILFKLSMLFEGIIARKLRSVTEVFIRPLAGEVTVEHGKNPLIASFAGLSNDLNEFLDL